MSVKGVLPVIPTPFREGRFDRDSFRRLVEYMAPAVDGYALLGSTGEAPSMTTPERMEVTEFALSVTPDDLSVVVGVSHTSQRDAIELTRHAQGNGASAMLCSVPYYFPNDPDGVLSYLSEIDEVLEVDLVLYDNPVATKTQLNADLVVEWAGSLSRMTAVKLTDHDLSKIEVWQRASLTVLAGDDPIAFRYLAAGVDGAMIIAPALFPEPFRRTWDLVEAGEISAAYEVFAREILPVIHVFGIGDETATSKVVLEELKVFASAEVRPPLVPTSQARRELLTCGIELAASATSELERP
jgi:4-hydroxy-tetrahydrodipicolinate synthase